MSFRGGGDAGGRAPKNAGPEYIRHMPKFLQKYEHLIEKREGQRIVRTPANESGPGSGPGPAQADLEDDNFEDQIHGATIVSDERDLPDGEGAGNASTWSQLKDQGNAAFAQGNHKEAVRLFSEAIRLDLKNSVLYSNRSAAHAAMGSFDEALSDGRKALALQPGWAKAHSRVGAALFGLRQYEEAVEVYEKAVKAEPKNKTFKEALEQARKKQQEVEEKEADSGKHTFRKRKQPASLAPGDPSRKDKHQLLPEKANPAKASAPSKLSFDDE